MEERAGVLKRLKDKQDQQKNAEKRKEAEWLESQTNLQSIAAKRIAPLCLN